MTDEQKKQIKQMRDKGLKYVDIAGDLGISVNTIKSHCRRNGLAAKKEPKKAIQKEKKSHCKQCGQPLKQGTRGKPKKFCCERCRRDWWKQNDDQYEKKAYYTLKCQECGTKFESYGNRKRKFCSHACYIKYRFEGGDSFDKGAV